MKATRSSSEMLGRKMTMVSYWRRPGGHSGSSLLSVSENPSIGGRPPKSLPKMDVSNSALKAAGDRRGFRRLINRSGILMGFLDLKKVCRGRKGDGG